MQLQQQRPLKILAEPEKSFSQTLGSSLVEFRVFQETFPETSEIWRDTVALTDHCFTSKVRMTQVQRKDETDQPEEESPASHSCYKERISTNA